MEDLQQKNPSSSVLMHQNREILEHPSKIISSKMSPTQLIVEFSLTLLQYQDQRFLLILSSSEGVKEKRKTNQIIFNKRNVFLVHLMDVVVQG